MIKERMGKGRGKIKYMMLGIMAFVAMIVTSCSSGDSSDAQALLETVPADADGAVVIRLNSMLKELGFKENKDGSSEVPEQMRGSLDSLRSGEARISALLFLEGKGGVSREALVYFSSTRQYVTGFLENPDEFRKVVEKELGGAFAEEEGVNLLRQYAYMGHQFWICVNGTPDAASLSRYPGLSTSQSLAGHEGIDLVTGSKSQVAGLGDLPSLMRYRSSQRTQISLLMNTLFESPTQIFFEGNVEKKNFSLSGRLLNSKGKPSKFLLPTGKIDLNVVNKLDVNADCLIAVDIPSELVSKITGLMSSFGGGLPESMLSMLRQIKGTSVYVSGGNNNQMIISTDGAPNATFKDFCSSTFGESSVVDGNSVWINKDASISGSISVKKEASALKGAMFGLVADVNENLGKGSGTFPIVLTLVPTDGTLEIRLQGETTVGILEAVAEMGI